ncbi:MAG: type III pantothenate kinase [Candidatus Wallbacteria bacterium]
MKTKKKEAINICVAAGNSYTKVGIYKDGALADFFKFESRPLSDLNSKVNFFTEKIKRNLSKKSENLPLLMTHCSTIKEAPDYYQALAEKLSASFLLINSELNIPLKINYNPENTLGTDRICAAVSAYKKYAAEADNILVIDFGTATTFNLIKKNTFEGGLILPGFGLYSNSLGNSCDRLFRVHFNKISGFLCRDTQSALVAGIYGGYSILINGLYEKLLNDAQVSPKDVCTVITGGFSSFFTTNVEFSVINDQNLVLDGMKILSEINFHSEFKVMAR